MSKPGNRWESLSRFKFDAIIKNPKLYKPAYSKYANSYTNGQLFTVNCDNCAATNLEVSIGSPDEPKTDLCLNCYSILAQDLEPTTYEPFCESDKDLTLVIDISPRNIIQHRFYVPFHKVLPAGLDYIANDL